MKSLLLAIAVIATAAFAIPVSAHCTDDQVTAQNDAATGTSGTQTPTEG